MSELRDEIAGMAYSTLAKVSAERDALRDENEKLRAIVESLRERLLLPKEGK